MSHKVTGDSPSFRTRTTGVSAANLTDHHAGLEETYHARSIVSPAIVPRDVNGYPHGGYCISSGSHIPNDYKDLGLKSDCCLCRQLHTLPAIPSSAAISQ